MQIVGEVEVFRIMQDGTSESVIKENNIVVDGASEVIVDMLTTPYSLKNVANSAALECSNFMVQAVSLGKAQELYGGTADLSSADTSNIGMHAVYNNPQFSSMYLRGLHTGDPSGFGEISPNVCAPVSPVALPKDPGPRDIRLENSSKTQIEFYYENSSTTLSNYVESSAIFSPVSGTLLSDFGHNLNALYSSSTGSSIAAFHQGCYAPSTGMSIRLFDGTKSRANLETVTDTPNLALRELKDSTTASAADLSGRYNTVGSMDQNGFLVAYAVQSHPASGDTTQGMAISAADTNSLAILGYNPNGTLAGSTAFLERPTVSYDFTISSSDVACLAMYKGITNIGLWALDLKETLKLEAAPFKWGSAGYTNNRRYKLFAKKIFNEDLTYIEDDGPRGLKALSNYSNLNVQWRMSFSFSGPWGS